jgi:hypothetical protein
MTDEAMSPLRVNRRGDFRGRGAQTDRLDTEPLMRGARA